MITAHCLVKNEENFVGHAINSVVDFVDKIIVFDTGSTDKTVETINQLGQKYPGKIIFEEKGVCDKKRHTELRQEMIDRTKTDWFMILDGDEIWPKRTMLEAVEVIKNNTNVESLVVPFYLCVGDIYHQHRKSGKINILGKLNFHYPRFIKIVRGVHWAGDYNEDSLFNESKQLFVNNQNSYFLQNKFWHVTHLQRSSRDDFDYSSGGSRKIKRLNTFFIIGKKIKESVPGVFEGADLALSAEHSFLNFFSLVKMRILKRIV